MMTDTTHSDAGLHVYTHERHVDFTVRCGKTLDSGYKCKNLLGVVVDGVLEIRHRGRKTELTAPFGNIRITCEVCGHKNHPIFPVASIKISDDPPDDGVP